MTIYKPSCHRLWMSHTTTIGIVALLLYFSALPGSRSEEQSSVVKINNQLNKEVDVTISESVNNLKTVDPIHSITDIDQFQNSNEQSSIIISTIKNSSYTLIPVTTSSSSLTTNESSKTGINLKSDSILHTGSDSRHYHLSIEPTKTIDASKELKILTTQHSGEFQGAPRQTSGPLKENDLKKSYKHRLYLKNKHKKTKRDIKQHLPNRSEEYVLITDNTDLQNKKYLVKVEERNKHGTGYNKIEKSLDKIAKISVNNEPVLKRVGYRKSRDEENRKANPDIQDILKGIVKILNGNANPGLGDAGRPPQRLQNTRINNRGPPRISDMPPLEFDTPPAFVPLLQQQQPPPAPTVTRVPPPYPFDLPPPVSGVPLPPQPNKPTSNLPSHPFIEGVPLPEMVVPGKPNKNNYSGVSTPEYDTISMSEADFNSQKIPLILTETKIQPAGKNNSTVDQKYITVKHNITTRPVNETVLHNKSDFTKTKLGGQKVTVSNTYNNKTYTKRTRPRPPLRPRPINGTRPTSKPSHIEITILKNTTQESDVVSATSTDLTENSTSTKVLNSTEESLSSVLKDVISDLVNGTGGTFLSPSSVKPEELSQNKRIEMKNNTDKIEMELELPMLLESPLGVGEATPVLEPSITDPVIITTEQVNSKPTSSLSMSSSNKPDPESKKPQNYNSYKARPGIVLDDTEYKPGGGHKRPAIITSRPPQGPYGEVFDVTVHAIQGPGSSSSGKPFVYPVDIDGVKVHTASPGNSDVHVITAPQEGQDFVSIDGKRTYINLFGESTNSPQVSPTATTQAPITGTGFAVPHKETRPSGQSPKRRPFKKPNHPPVRIDTCIVGDDSTCDTAQNEMCRTEDGVSSCHCRPGYNRKKHRDPCRRVVSMLTSLRVDRLYDRKIVWHNTLQDPDSEEYHQLSYEASQAIDSAMSMTPFSDDFINSHVNSIYSGKNTETSEPAVYINMTIQLEENLDTMRPAVKHDIQKHLISVIHRRQNNVGTSAVWVNSPPGSILALQDLDECSSAELHDCHEQATCSNTFGSFRCQCQNGFRDPWAGNIHRQGRNCETCPTDYCNNRGQCKYEQGHQVCYCTGSFYGTQCEVDGEVLGVAIGASVAAAIIITLTLICLCMWSRRWSREQKSAVGLGMGSPVFGYMASGATVKTPSVGGPPYQVSLEDRIRWAQIADVMAQANHYAQPDPGVCGNRSSFGGYPTLASHTMSMSGTLPHGGIIPPVPLPRLGLGNKTAMSTYGGHSQHGSIHQSLHGLRTSADTTSSSEEEDRADLLGRNFNAPRPKSRASVANQSGIYYDVDFERSDMYGKHNSIPLSTYTLNPHQARPFCR